MIAGVSGTTPQSTRARRRSDTEIFSSSWTRELSLSTLMQSRFSSLQSFKFKLFELFKKELIAIPGHEVLHLERAGRRFCNRDCKVHPRHDQLGKGSGGQSTLKYEKIVKRAKLVSLSETKRSCRCDVTLRTGRRLETTLSDFRTTQTHSFLLPSGSSLLLTFIEGQDQDWFVLGPLE